MLIYQFEKCLAYFCFIYYFFFIAHWLEPNNSFFVFILFFLSFLFYVGYILVSQKRLYSIEQFHIHLFVLSKMVWWELLLDNLLLERKMCMHIPFFFFFFFFKFKNFFQYWILHLKWSIIFKLILIFQILFEKLYNFIYLELWMSSWYKPILFFVYFLLLTLM